jgi:hypothetical protein
VNFQFKLYIRGAIDKNRTSESIQRPIFFNTSCQRQQKLENKLLTDVVDKGLKKIGITISKPALAVLCIIFGIIVIVFPEVIAWVIGIFLIIQGILLLTDYMEIRGQQPKS